MKSVTLEDFRSHLDDYLTQVEREDVLLTRAGEPFAVLKGLPQPANPVTGLPEERRQELEETRLWLAASDRVLRELWDNEEDAGYDQL
ncbi:MAG: type II toxin-antitoxin system Phd/YefM family antitoxin [Planctomycetaceae bacterium]